MAVVGTFIYMATIDEASKRAMHTAVFILTALLAATGATRYADRRLPFSVFKILRPCLDVVRFTSIHMCWDGFGVELELNSTTPTHSNTCGLR